MSPGNKLIVKNFGPIKQADVVFNRFTVFVGPQGSGKSTLAKLYSMFMWLEKRLIRGLESQKDAEKTSRFKNRYCGYHRLTSYFCGATEIEFFGQAYHFIFKDDKFNVIALERMENVDVMKVMYIPSERNLLSSLGNLAGLKSLPPFLQTFKDDYDEASLAYAQEYVLPINGVRFEYDRLNHVSWLLGDDYKVRLSDASSGFQAVLPMLLVSQYLAETVAARHENGNLSIAERKKLHEEVAKVVNNPDLSQEVREAALSALSARFVYSGFVNVVEELEENLYPDSQRDVLYTLLSLANRESTNQLVLTTHSPYIINYLTLAIKAKSLISDGGDREAIEKIVPISSCLSANDVAIYELTAGRAEQLSMPNGLPSDTNSLNMAMGKADSLFGELLDIEDLIYGKQG
jgi:energy-coupling factor transporter ATP-binding protein EcfA2